MTAPENDSPPPFPQQTTRAPRRIDNAVIVAIVGVFGVVITAIIGLIGIRLQVYVPIEATSTARTGEAQLTEEAIGTLTAHAQLTSTLIASTATQLAFQVVASSATPSPSATTTMTPATLPTLRPLPDPGWSEEQLRVFSVIRRELDSISARDLYALQTIYMDDAVVVDKRGTPDDKTDDLTYVGWDEIRQRYLKTFNYDWLRVTPVNLQVSVDHDTAFALHEGLLVNNNAYNRHITYYELRRIGTEWRIARLEFDYR